jgi:GNAT superfamily N-acetyltransferase
MKRTSAGVGVVRRFAAMVREGGGDGIDPGAGLEIGAGTIEDYDTLAAFHYVRGRPALVERVIVARDGELPAAVITISRPTLNGPWRNVAWPGVFACADQRERARRLNELLRTISRVVVDPRWRGLGVARRLVRAYLDSAGTPLTEVLTTMGPASLCFSAAGMRAVSPVRSAHDARLLVVLERAGVEPWQLLDPAARARVDCGALRVWARSSRAHRWLADGETGVLALRAARALVSGRTAYVFGHVEAGGHGAERG